MSASVACAAEGIIPPPAKIILERTRCFGICPAYKVTIQADGKVEFVGEKFVNAIGLQQKTISSKKVALMVDAADNINFFDLKGNYDCLEGANYTTVTLTISRYGDTRKIVHYHGCQSANKEELAALTQLEDKIDELSEIAEWKKFDATP
jgi:hypothetical protein